jgi:hypothetical protein
VPLNRFISLRGSLALLALADGSDPDQNVNLYVPKSDAARDVPIVSLFDDWGARLERR